MRKLLLASAAMLGAGLALTGYASAQPLPIDPTGGKLVVQPSTGGGANNNNNYQAPMLPGPVANPTPGSMVIHLYGRVLTGVTANWSNLPSALPGAKLDPISIMSYMRVYPGVDAMATNGLRYGASIELRENFAAPATSTLSTGASGYTSNETVFVRRAFVYAGMDNIGIVRIGQADGPIGIFDNGVTTFQFLPSGNLNGGDLEAGHVGGATIGGSGSFAFATQAGNEYGYNKIVYLSPQFAGFDVGLSWGPNTSNGESWGKCALTAAGIGGCPTVSSSPVPADGARQRNLIEAGIRYQGKFGDVGILAYGAYLGSGHANYNGPTLTGAAALGSAGSGRFDDMSAGNFGAAVTFAGLTVGGNMMIGDVNGQLGLKPAGGVSQKAWLVGAKYTMGPMTVGAVFESIDDQGFPGLTNISQRHQAGLDLGASYTVAPGFSVWAEYEYETRHQGLFNFATGAVGTGYNTARSQGAMVGAVVTW